MFFVKIPDSVIIVNYHICCFHKHGEGTPLKFVKVVTKMIINVVLRITKGELHLPDHERVFDFEVYEDVAGAFVEFVFYSDDLKIVAC
jgi:hypothetical protein